MDPEVFLDASYAVALSAVTDEYHERAVHVAHQLRSSRTRIVTTHAVLLEIGSSLARHRYRAAAVRLLRSLESDPSVEVLAVTDDLYAKARQLTSDIHFQQAGFRALLRAKED